MSTDTTTMPRAAWVLPVLALLFYGLVGALGLGEAFSPTPLGIAFAATLVPILFGAVFAAVHHAEVLAQRTGEPYGTLILSMAVTVIEVALIASVMLSGESSPALARDTVFAVVMIVCNGLVGACIFLGGLRYGEQSFRVTGASAYLAVLLPLTVLTLVMPTYTRTTAGPVYAESQLAFVSLVTLALYGVFLYIQTVRHRSYFIVLDREDREATSHPPSNRTVAASAVLLLTALAGVILLAKKFAVIVEATIAAAGAPRALVGVVVALLVLMPESVAAVQAARRNELQKSLNLALGSTLATIGLTMPAVAAVSIVLAQDLVLGLDPKDTLLLALTLGVSLLTFGTGRTNILHGFVHLVIFATFVFLVLVP